MKFPLPVAILVLGAAAPAALADTLRVPSTDFATIQAAVDAPRLHHQWFPDQARFEGIQELKETVKRLRQMGHAIEGTKQGDAHSIRVDPKTDRYYGAADRWITGKVAAY